MDLDGCYGKTRHGTKAAALGALDAMSSHRRSRRRRLQPGRTLHVYRCRCCAGWHIGSCIGNARRRQIRQDQERFDREDYEDVVS